MQPASAAEQNAAVDAIWADAVWQRPSLFDGRVFVADRLDPAGIVGYWTAYRVLFAQLREPHRFPLPHHRALAVNGLLRCKDGIVLGRRAADAIYRPACWQCVPAGSVEARDDDRVSIREQLLSKLAEEIGLLADEVDGVLPVVAIEHPNGRVVDIGCLVRTDLSFDSVERRWRETGSQEYDALRVVPDDGVASLLAGNEPTLLESARLLVRYGSGSFGE